MIINPTPAIHVRYLGFIYLARASPKITAMLVASKRARDAARNTRSLEFSLFVANSRVASWVLSPNSAKSTVINIVRKIFKVIFSNRSISFRMKHHAEKSIWSYVQNKINIYNTT